ncbi:MAG: RcpC/CpaB family pilus assembly protein, partial [Aeromicrobium sp.]
VVGSVRDKLVPAGYQEVTIALGPERAVGGVLRAGDTVGVVSSVLIGGDNGVTQVIANKVVITKIALAITGEEGAQASGGYLITLAVKTRQVGEIVNTAEYGKLYLTKQYEDTEGGSGGLVSKVELGSGQ